MPAHKHSLACLDTKSYFKGKGMLCRKTRKRVTVAGRGKVSEKWPLPPPALVQLFRQAGKDTLKPIQRFIERLPLKDEHDNARAAEHYRKIATEIKPTSEQSSSLRDSLHEIANQLWD